MHSLADVHSLSDLPLPLVHTAWGAAVCAVVAALRPEVAGLRTSVLVAGALAVTTATVFTLYDHLVYGRRLRHALSASALPAAAIAAFLAVLAGSHELALRVAAGLLGALIIGGIPHLGGLRAVGRESTAVRLLRDAAGVAVLAPLLAAVSGDALPTGARAALAVAGVVLVSFDALLTEALPATVAAEAAMGLAVCFSLLVVLLPRAPSLQVRAALLLVLWYGARGLAGVLLSHFRRHAGLIAEYALFVVVAVAGLMLAVSR